MLSGIRCLIWRGRMDILGLKQEVPQDPVGQLLTLDGHPDIAVVDLGRELSVALRVSWPPARPFQSGGAIDSAWLQPLLGAGSTAAPSGGCGADLWRLRRMSRPLRSASRKAGIDESIGRGRPAGSETGTVLSGTNARSG